jgi:hypothetical protein
MFKRNFIYRLMRYLKTFEMISQNEFYKEIDADEWDESSEWGEPKEILTFDKNEINFIKDIYNRITFDGRKTWETPTWEVPSNITISNPSEPLYVTIDGVRFDSSEKWRETKKSSIVKDWKVEIKLSDYGIKKPKFIVIDIYKNPDEYYHISIEKTLGDDRYFICDQLEGIEKLFQDLKFIK